MCFALKQLHFYTSESIYMKPKTLSPAVMCSIVTQVLTELSQARQGHISPPNQEKIICMKKMKTIVYEC